MFKASFPFNVAMKILVPTTTMVKGSPKTVYSDPEKSELINGSLRSFGGTENVSNGVLTIFSTATVETWLKLFSLFVRSQLLSGPHPKGVELVVMGIYRYNLEFFYTEGLLLFLQYIYLCNHSVTQV